MSWNRCLQCGLPISEDRSDCLLCAGKFQNADRAPRKSQFGHWLAGLAVLVAVVIVSRCMDASETSFRMSLLVILVAAGVFISNSIGALISGAALRAKHFTRFGFFVLAVVCWFGAGRFFRNMELNVTQSYSADNCPIDGAVRVTCDGKPLPSAGGDVKKFRVRGRVNEDQLTVESFGPDGWVARPFRKYGDELNLEQIPTTNLYIDNRGHGATNLKCGALSLDIPAGFQGRKRILTPRERANLLIDGKEVGSFAAGDYVVDVSGTHSYDLREIIYVSGMVNSRIQLNQLAGMLPGHPQALPDLPIPNLPVRYNARHIHRVPKSIDYFLTGHPDRIKVYFDESTIRTEWVDAE